MNITRIIVTTRSAQLASDRALRDMIEELAASMYEPLRVVNITSRREVMTQAGYYCFPCDITYSSRSGLFHHDRRVHQDFPFACDLCGAGYRRIGPLRTHVETAHGVYSTLQDGVEVSLNK